MRHIKGIIGEALRQQGSVLGIEGLDPFGRKARGDPGAGADATAPIGMAVGHRDIERKGFEIGEARPGEIGEPCRVGAVAASQRLGRIVLEDQRFGGGHDVAG